MVIQMSMPQEQFNKSMTRIQHDRMHSVEVNFCKPSELTRRTDENMRPNKRSKLSNAAAPLNGFVVKKILSFCIKRTLLGPSTGDDARFVKLNQIRYAAVYGMVTFMRW